MDEQALHPAIRRWLARNAELAASLPDLASPDLTRHRAAAVRLSDLLAEEFVAPAPPDVPVDWVRIDGADGALDVRRYRPPVAGPWPTQVYLHGGGFVGGSAREMTNDRLLAERARRTSLQILSLEYRLAPEHPYPAAVLDALALLEQLADGPVRWHADRDRLGVGGASAGATIAATTALRWRDHGGPPLVHQCLEIPAAAFRLVGRSAALATPGELAGAEAAARAYLAGGDDGLAAPLDAPDVAGAAPALVMTAEWDPLRDGGEAYAERLREAGIPVRLERGAGHLHATCSLTAALPTARDWQRRCARHLREAYRSSPRGDGS
jgi:acetyl esterase